MCGYEKERIESRRVKVGKQDEREIEKTEMERRNEGRGWRTET